MPTANIVTRRRYDLTEKDEARTEAYDALRKIIARTDDVAVRMQAIAQLLGALHA